LVKQIYSKIIDHYADASLEPFLLLKNKEEQTCFQICCINGYSNIIEYFLRERKLYFFLQVTDLRDGNTPLHLATLHGHSSIVKCLIEYGADLNATNRENLKPFELSCRHNYFEISKLIINHNLENNENDEKIQNQEQNLTQFKNSENEKLLHIACSEGAHDVVKFILSQGVAINKLDKDNRNCLDIAIHRLLFKNKFLFEINEIHHINIIKMFS
jgi:ankyrin repeat protein